MLAICARILSGSRVKTFEQVPTTGLFARTREKFDEKEFRSYCFRRDAKREVSIYPSRGRTRSIIIPRQASKVMVDCSATEQVFLAGNYRLFATRLLMTRSRPVEKLIESPFWKLD